MLKKTKATEATPTVKIGAVDGIVWCGGCLIVRNDDGTLAPKCQYCGGDWMLTSQINVDNLSDDIKAHRERIRANLAKWNLEIPPNVDIALMKAERELSKTKRYELVMKAYIKADNMYYSAWSNGKIKDKKEPMTDETKVKLSRKRLDLPEVKNEAPLMKVSISAIKRQTDPEVIRDMYYEVYGATAGANITIERMRASMMEAIREMAEAGKVPKEEETMQEVKESRAALIQNDPKKPKKEPKVKLALYDDKKAQEEREAKWAWVKKGSWRADPEHDGGTILEIICTACGAERTIHAADCFQVKYCIPCKKASKSKKSA